MHAKILYVHQTSVHLSKFMLMHLFVFPLICQPPFNWTISSWEAGTSFFINRTLESRTFLSTGWVLRKHLLKERPTEKDKGERKKKNKEEKRKKKRKTSWKNGRKGEMSWNLSSMTLLTKKYYYCKIKQRDRKLYGSKVWLN